jgi:site-specific DNA-methyltransferase (adenine-specific)
MKKYSIIYADPPWNGTPQLTRDRNRGNIHYPLMKVKKIKDLSVKDISNDNAILFLWIIDSQLFDALEVIKSWGFIYKTVAFTWIKKTKSGKEHYGLGRWTRKNPEMCLLATKGKTYSMLKNKPRQLVNALIGKHSEKPQEIRNRIIEMFGDLPRIELFARQKTEGWDVWGNEVESDIKLK